MKCLPLSGWGLRHTSADERKRNGVDSARKEAERVENPPVVHVFSARYGKIVLQLFGRDCWKTRCVGSLSCFVTHFTSIYNNAASLILFSSLFGSIARPWPTMRAWERERALAEMTSGIKSRPESSHHCVNTPATATHLATCIQIQMRPFLTSSHSWHCCHSVPWQSGEKVRRSIIPLLTGRVRRPWPPRLNFKWITEGGGLLCETWNSAAHDRQLLSVMSLCQWVTPVTIVVTRCSSSSPDFW